jgi:hypothetical protein
VPTKPEVLAIEEAHRAAQARLGIAGAYLALRDWGGVSTTAPVGSADAWLTRSLTMIRAIRRKSVRLARAYYQVARALETGYTLGLPEFSDDPTQLTMADLRKQYLDVLLEVADIDVPISEERKTSIPTVTDSDELFLHSELQHTTTPIQVGERYMDFETTGLDSYIQDLISATDHEDDDQHIQVDPFEWPEEEPWQSIEEIFADELKAAAQDRAAKLEKILKDAELSARQAFDKAQKIHDAAGSVNAGTVDKAGIDAGRQLLDSVSNGDPRVMMWARITGPNPCAFCAMLASRGFVYLSRQRASLGGRSKGKELDSYHPNCHCSFIMRWADISDPTAPDRTAHYMQLWKDEMRGKRIPQRGTSNDTLNHWRRLIAKERRDAREALRKRYLAEAQAKA